MKIIKTNLPLGRKVAVRNEIPRGAITLTYLGDKNDPLRDAYFDIHYPDGSSEGIKLFSGEVMHLNGPLQEVRLGVLNKGREDNVVVCYELPKEDYLFFERMTGEVQSGGTRSLALTHSKCSGIHLQRGDIALDMINYGFFPPSTRESDDTIALLEWHSSDGREGIMRVNEHQLTPIAHREFLDVRLRLGEYRWLNDAPSFNYQLPSDVEAVRISDLVPRALARRFRGSVL